MVDHTEYEYDNPPDSIDELLTSALAEQGREKQAVVDAVRKASESVTRAEFELKQVRDLLSSRDDTVSEILLRVQAIEERTQQLFQHVQDMPSSDEVGTTVRAAGDSLLADVREDQVEVVRALGRTFESALDDVRRQMAMDRQDFLDQLSVVAEYVIDKNNTTAELLVEHLVGYLAQRDETMHRAREQMLIELFSKLGAALGSRQGKKVAGSMGAVAGTQPAPVQPPPPARFQPGKAKRAEPPPPPQRRSLKLGRKGPAPEPEPEYPVAIPTRDFVDNGPRPQDRDRELLVDTAGRDERDYQIDAPDPWGDPDLDRDPGFFDGPPRHSRGGPARPNAIGDPPRDA